jgi:hypothetical protein
VLLGVAGVHGDHLLSSLPSRLPHSYPILMAIEATIADTAVGIIQSDRKPSRNVMREPLAQATVRTNLRELAPKEGQLPVSKEKKLP